jgi:hypothetical protein
MASNRLTIIQDGDKITVTSNDSNIKQVFFGFGSWGTGLGIKEHPEYYGRSIEKGKNVRADDEEWQWDLTMELVKDLYKLITEDLDCQQKSALDDGTWTAPKADDDVLKALGDVIARKAPVELDEFTKAYVIAALWSTNDESTPEGGEPIDSNYGISDLSSEALTKIQTDCAKFQTENKELLEQAYLQYQPRDGYQGASLAGHDFWLTRCGHGCGFWDRGQGDLGRALTEASKRFGEAWIQVGDDNQLYGF